MGRGTGRIRRDFGKMGLPASAPSSWRTTPAAPETRVCISWISGGRANVKALRRFPFFWFPSSAFLVPKLPGSQAPAWEPARLRRRKTQPETPPLTSGPRLPPTTSSWFPSSSLGTCSPPPAQDPTRDAPLSPAGHDCPDYLTIFTVFVSFAGRAADNLYRLFRFCGAANRRPASIMPVLIMLRPVRFR